MKTALLESRSARRAAAPAFAGLIMTALFLCGCTNFPTSIRDLGPTYKPANIYRQSEVMPPRVRRVAVLPLTTADSSALLMAGVENLETILRAELEKSERFEIIPVTGGQLREWTGQTIWKADDLLPLNFFRRLHEGTGCDAVLFCQLIRYQPYEPLAVGWKFSLVERWDTPKGSTPDAKTAGPQILWSADEVFDAGDVAVANAARSYYSQHLRNEAPAPDASTILGSPTRFGQYTLNALFGTMPDRKAPEHHD